jgi:MFS family permease
MPFEYSSSPRRIIPLSRIFQAFRSRNYRLLWPANVCTNVSRFGQITLLAWLVLELTGSPLSVALVGVFASAPMLLFGLAGGVLTDTLNRRTLLLVSQAVSLTVAIVMSILLWTDNVLYWHSYLAALTTGLSFTLDMPSRRSLIHDLLGRGGVTNGFALDSLGQSVSRMLGPAMAGALMATVGVTGGYFAVTLIYLLAVGLLWNLQVPMSIATGTTVLSSIFSNMARGISYVRGEPVLVGVVLITILMNVMLFPYQTMVPVVAKNVLEVGPGLMGVLLAADGLGAMIGAVAIASAANVRYHGRLYAGGTALCLVSLLLFSISRSYLLSLPILLTIGIGAGIFSSLQGAMVVLLAPEELRGKALGVMSLAIGTGPFGALFLGIMANIKGVTFALGLNGITGLVLIGLIAFFMPAIRRPILVDVEGHGFNP